MLDFNSAGPQQTPGTGQVVPPKSIVMCRVEVQQPKAGSESPNDSCLSVKKETGNEVLNLRYEVIAGKFEGVKFFGSHVVSGSEKATNISMSFFRAMVEAGRQIRPDDASQPACEARKISSWFELESLTFPLQVLVQPPKAGDKYLNNEPYKIITPDMEQYPVVMLENEIITDEPIPVIPAATGQPITPGGQKAAWGNPPQAQQPVNATAPSQPASNVPSWARK